MPRHPISFTELTHQAVREAPEPLPFAEILRRVAKIMPITTKNPKGTIRNAISQSRLIVATGDGRYGWLPRLTTGAVLRLPLSASGRAVTSIEFTEEVRDTLWPAFFEIQKRSDRSPAHVQLPDSAWTDWPLDFLGQARWGTRASPEFWRWFHGLKTVRGDQLIISVLDGEARRFAVNFQPRRDRDEATIAERNRRIVEAALNIVRRRPDIPPVWDITPTLLAAGHYHHPAPPDPLEEILLPRLRVSEAARGSGRAWIDGTTLRFGDQPVDLAAMLFGQRAAVYDVDNPPALPREYQPGPGRRPRPSRMSSRGSVTTYTLRVAHRQHPGAWRDIEIAADQTLEDLHLAIQDAFDWADDHLYSFFMSGRPDDRSSEIGSPWSESAAHTHQVSLDALELEVGCQFLYLFDYGDGHEFDVEVVAHNPAAPVGSFPRVVSRRGNAPPQYGEPEE